MHEYDLSQWILFFFIYSFIGWIWESCYVSLKKRRWVNRGFMHGPMLPLYGSGALVILICTIGVRDSIPLVFVMGMIAATILEYCTGAVMERLFRVRYWDYSKVKFNINGYICPAASLCWGCFSVLLIRWIHVPIEDAVLRLPLLAAEGIGFGLTVAAAADFTQSFNEAMDLKRILIQLDESREQIRRLQEKLKVTADEVKEDYIRRVDQAVEKQRSRKAAYLEWIDMKREERRLLLKRLAARADTLLREEIPGRLLSDEQREELAQLRGTVENELRKISGRTDRRWLHIVSHLRRNPTAVSDKFKDTMEEIQKILDLKR
ncbi:MAG TPA: hypothetical protein H9730_01285 [Candidatus Mediterraneibacter stercoripullorum]|nr:hypothetical protein [Candidatus Mediterraneibacter stercoripullorum]